MRSCLSNIFSFVAAILLLAIAPRAYADLAPPGPDVLRAICDERAEPPAAICAEPWERALLSFCDAVAGPWERPRPGFEGPDSSALPGVALTSDLANRIADISGSFRELTGGKTLVVTSGVRTVAEQAQIMFDNLDHGDDLRIYVDQEAIEQITDLYEANAAADEPPEMTVGEIAELIADRANDGHVISAHLIGTAFDLRKDGVDRDALAKAAAAHGYVVLDEIDHYHLQPGRYGIPFVVVATPAPFRPFAGAARRTAQDLL